MGGFLFGTVGSPNSTSNNRGGSIGGIKRIAELGLSAMELGWVQSVRVTEKSCTLINLEAKNDHVCLSVHAPYFINLNSDEIEWPKSKKRLIDSAYFGYLAGATDVVFHPGSYFNEPQKAAKKAIIRLEEVVSTLQHMHVSINLRPETMGKSALLGSLDDVILLSKRIEGISPCLDFAHLYARDGTGKKNSKDEWCKDLELYGDELGENALKHLHIHLSGIEFTTRGEKKHIPIKESTLNIPELFKALKQFFCQGRILCESPLLEDDALYLKMLWLAD